MKKLNLKLILASACLLGAFHSNAQADSPPVNPIPPTSGFPIDWGNLPQWIIDLLNSSGNQNPNAPSTKGGASIVSPVWDNSYSNPCQQLAPPWFVGGNNVIPPQTYVWPVDNNPPTLLFDIGTCNKYPFVLKANDRKTIFIREDSRVGIGLDNSNPQAALDIQSSNPNDQSSFRIYGDANGNVSSTSQINMTTGGDFNINTSSDFNVILPGPYNALKVDGATGNTNVFFKLGVGTTAPAAKLDVSDAADARILAHTTSNHDAGMWIKNDVALPNVNGQACAAEYGMHVDNNGIGYITQDHNLSLNLLKFKYNAAANRGQVWMGNHTPSAPHDNFDFAVEGKILAQSIFVTATAAWADYVFAKEYKLPKLADVEAYYIANKHLPEIPTAREVEERGVDVGEMNVLLLKKVEELTLYVVDQQKKQEQLQSEVEKLKARK